MYNKLSNLIRYLANEKLFKYAEEVNNILENLLDDEELDVSSIINGIGLEEDGTINNMQQGYSLSPFFTHFGPVDQ